MHFKKWNITILITKQTACNLCGLHANRTHTQQHQQQYWAIVVLHSTAPDNTTVADASAAGRYTHMHSLTQSHSLLTPTRSHTFTRSPSLCLLSLARSLARSLAHPLSVSHIHMYNFSRTRLFTQTEHTRSGSLSESFVCSLSYLLSFACTLSVSVVHICAILHFLQTHTHQAHQVLAEWADFYLNQFIFI